LISNAKTALESNPRATSGLNETLNVLLGKMESIIDSYREAVEDLPGFGEAGSASLEEPAKIESAEREQVPVQPRSSGELEPAPESRPVRPEIRRRRRLG